MAGCICMSRCVFLLMTALFRIPLHFQRTSHCGQHVPGDGDTAPRECVDIYTLCLQTEAFLSKRDRLPSARQKLPNEDKGPGNSPTHSEDKMRRVHIFTKTHASPTCADGSAACGRSRGGPLRVTGTTRVSSDHPSIVISSAPSATYMKVTFCDRHSVNHDGKGALGSYHANQIHQGHR
jgi:hypothetical protein